MATAVQKIARDPSNSVLVEALATTLQTSRQWRASEQMFDRLAELRPEQPILKALECCPCSIPGPR